MNLVFNLTSDVLIMSIPLPLLVRAHLPLKKKALLVFPFSLGLFTMLCAILSKRLSFTHPYSAEWVYWYCREASTAMIVANMPYSWALIRKIFNLRSFFGDSTAGHIQAGQPRELTGHSLGVLHLDSQSRSRQVSHSDAEHGKLSWQRLKLHTSREDTSKSWVDRNEFGKDKEINVDATPASSSTSSAGSVRKPPPTARTDWTLDRLYPLDDEQLTAPDPMQRRYEGV
jgi:hypothetical protein